MWTGIAECSGRRLGNWRSEDRGRRAEQGSPVPDRGLVFLRQQVM
jgi:hypothetical protein